MLDRLPLNNDQRTLLGQVLRYGITGGIVTAFGVAAYLIAVGWGQVPPRDGFECCAVILDMLEHIENCHHVVALVGHAA